MNGSHWSARAPLAIGFTAVALMLGGLGGWSVGTEIAGAIVAQGTVEVESGRQVVQHPDGGVVGEILARDGELVAAGDVLVRLDGTYLRSELAVVERQLADIFARRARLVAERDGAEAPDFDAPPDFVLAPAETIRAQIEGQQSLFTARRASIRRQQTQIAEQRVQIEQQIEGFEAQRAALGRQHELVGAELAKIEDLFARRLVEATRLLDLQREDAQLQGEIGRLAALIAEARTRIGGLEIEEMRLADARHEEAITRLRDLEYSEIELEERRRSLVLRLARLDVRAPVAGTVFGSRVFALRSVVQPAEAIMYLVPADQRLMISARIDPIDVEQVFPGQEVSLELSAFSRRTTPRVSGRVLRVSADAEKDAATGATYFEAILEPEAASFAALQDVALVPGMPVEAFLKTGERTPMSYLLRPLSVYFGRALRED
jgi:HlyD family secretion protein